MRFQEKKNFRRKNMAHAETLCRAPPMPPPTSRRSATYRLGSLLTSLGALFSEWRRRASSRRELAVLCDRCLRDMGATRYDVSQEVRKPFWRA
jgi:uncharacterized protein YjiS (DUF1127 family)